MTFQGEYRSFNRMGMELVSSPFLKVSFETSMNYLTHSCFTKESDFGQSSSARIVLDSLGKSDKNELSVEESSDIKTIFSTSRFNGDGVIPESAITDEELLVLFKEIITCIQPIEDRGGRLV